MTITPEQFLSEWLESENHPDAALLEEVKRLRAAGWRVYLATNQEAHRVRHLLDVVGLGQVVDGEFASCSVGFRKPQPEYYAEVARRLGLNPQQIVFWDDSPDNVQGALAADWQAQLYRDVTGFQLVMGKQNGL